MPPYEFLLATANGVNPYWEDTDQTNKHWVFPGRPDLEEKANTRSLNLDSDDEQNFEQATDLTTQEVPRVTISNITEDKVGEFEDDASDIGKEVAAATPVEKAPVVETPAPVVSEPVAETAPVDVSEAPETVTEPEGDGGGDYDDLPF